jgi:hypothetical protein
MNAFKIVGCLLFILLAAWIVYSALPGSAVHPAPQVLGLGNAFEGNLQLPAEKIQTAFSSARDRMLQVNQVGARLHMAGNITAWLTFAATACITLIVGFFGRAPQPNVAAPVNTEGLPARTVRLIGLLASIAAVMTASSSMSLAKAQDYFAHADSIRELIVHDRAQVISAKDADEAQAVLDDLLLKSAR